MKFLDATLVTPTLREMLRAAAFASVFVLVMSVVVPDYHEGGFVITWCGLFLGALGVEAGLSLSKSPRAFIVLIGFLVVVSLAA